MTQRATEAQFKHGVGQDLRRIRKLRRMTIARLAAATGRSAGFLSQVERGLSQISLRDLQIITQALNVPLSWFFVNEAAPEEEQGYVVRADARRQVGSREGGLVEELLSPDLGGSFEVFRSMFEPGAEMDTPQRRKTEEAGYIVTGELDLFIDERCFHLTQGDSFRFSGELYRWRNPGDQPAVVIWVIAPPIY